MQVSEQGLALIRQFEGFSGKAYRCPAGVATIGYGHRLKPGEDDGSITAEQAERLLREDVQAFTEGLNALTTIPLTQNQFDALTSLAYNIGLSAFRKSKLRQALNNGDYTEAAKQFRRWDYAGGRRLPGLSRRRDAEAALFLTPPA